MAITYTENYHLGKQEDHTDKFDMTVITDNVDKIDEALTGKVDKSTRIAGIDLSANISVDELQTALNIEDGANKTVVDSSLSSSSTNPVQNKKVYEALNGKQNTLSIAQLNAANSGITSEKVSTYDGYAASKQNALSFMTTPSSTNKVATKTEIDAIEEDLAQVNDKVGKILKKEAKIYGFNILKNESDPAARVVYTDDAIGMTPAGISGTDTFSYGSWKDAFFIPRPCMIKSNGKVDYYLDPNDFKKKLNGTASDVTNLAYDGNAMMEWDKMYWKYIPADDEIEGGFRVSNVKVDDTYHCWCNYDMNDNIIDHFYTAIYTGTGTTKLRSMSGVQLLPANGNGSTTTTQETTRALANGDGWYIETWADRMLMSSLLILMGKSTNTQAVFGAGLTAGSQTAKEQYITGTLDDKGLFYSSTSADVACKCFGMENFFGCQWNRVAGCISVDRDVKVKLTWGKADGSDTIGYNQTGAGYMSIGTVPDTNSYAKSMAFADKGFMTSAVNGSATTYWCDGFYQNTGTRYLLVGGYSNGGVNAGAFCFSLGNAPSSADWSLGASLSFKPLG